MTYRVLHVGCGKCVLPAIFANDQWRELRLDIDRSVEPDFVASMTDMPCVPDDSVEAVFSSHNLEHLCAHEVPTALLEFHRVLKPGGSVMLRVPDAQEIARYVAAGKLEEVLYVSGFGPISPIDVLWGLRSAIAEGNHFMAHKTGFTPATLRTKLQHAGFESISMASSEYEIKAIGVKPGPKLPFAFDASFRESYRSRWRLLWSLISRR